MVPISPRAMGPVRQLGIPIVSILCNVPRSSGAKALVACGGGTPKVCQRSVASLTSVTHIVAGKDGGGVVENLILGL